MAQQRKDAGRMRDKADEKLNTNGLSPRAAKAPENTRILHGIIRKCIGGFYYVEAADTVYECRARGIFRNQGMTPVAGDRAVISVLPDGKGSLDRIEERKNSLVRPPVANLDYLAVVVSMAEPAPSPLVVDKMLALAEWNHVEPIVVINKIDLQDPVEWVRIYRRAGFEVFSVSARLDKSVEPLRCFLGGKVTAFTGNSGVGKSSLLNVIDPRFSLETGAISQKLGRGRHTTRSAELFPLENGGYIVDTPGFASLDLERIQRIYKEELPYCFREFVPLLGRCRFTSCSHTKEAGCAVLEAVAEGKISPQRHESYKAMYDEVKDWKTWQ